MAQRTCTPRPVSNRSIARDVTGKYFVRMRLPYPSAHDFPLILAPMAGVSEAPFRQICRGMGADVVISEFLSSEAIRRRIRTTLEGAEFEECERPIGIQIYGADPNAMAEAAALITEHYEPEFIDINFGCPVKKVVKRNGGSGCLKDLGLVEEVIRAVSRGTHLPVTVKIRSGWSEEMRDPVKIALRCQDAGARVLTLHPRTRAQMYSGNARWDEIASVVEALEIPVVGNGDIKTAEDALRMRQRTGCAGVMIARGSFGQPWIFEQARALLDGRPVPATPPVEERFRVALEHARMAADYEPDPRGAALEFRKHLGWYVKGLFNAAELKRRLYAVTSLGEVEGIFADYLASGDHLRSNAASSDEGVAGDAGEETPDRTEPAAA